MKTGSKVKVSNKRFPGHDFLYVVFTFQTHISNDKGDKRPFLNRIIPFDIKHVIWWPFCFCANLVNLAAIV